MKTGHSENEYIYLEKDGRIGEYLGDFNEVLTTLVDLYQPMIDNYEKVKQDIKDLESQIVRVNADYDRYGAGGGSIPISRIAAAFVEMTKDSNPGFASTMSTIIEQQEAIQNKIKELEVVEKTLNHQHVCLYAGRAVSLAKEAKKALENNELRPLRDAIREIESLMYREYAPSRRKPLVEVVLRNLPLSELHYHSDRAVPESGYVYGPRESRKN
ncbi:hypothetical protein [Paenibacillus larvae]|uniref:Uncharacterized protein n=1 Tax=Paenibacillus larvae subsp. larvae TaxID=147375 RepID=A0A2L1U7J1_9BACL|nr:hypothetical protein [Paenibacillus larvae]AVF28885.1 hypothetical protein ERICIII_04883 [Paenibacillus larvae subsp. larvae]MCY9502912.1 hypothetical protein [Paenibacillus larvae]MCY9746380.1 hypothetical protein [Paenibacillus larvae]MCY9752078.1 hypothetical protein [Paenibacillus larvae]MDR5608779.1 hypothetical protein [Paenibacillus larvae]